MMRRVHGQLPPRGEARSGGPPLLALVLHVVVAIFVVRAVSVPVLAFLSRTGEPPVEESLTFVEPADAPEPVVVAPPPVRATTAPTVTEAPPPVASLPVMPIPGRGADTGAAAPPGPPMPVASGRQVFGSGIPGLTTGPVDPRLVAPPGIPNAPVRSNLPTTNSVVSGWVGAYWDSIAKVQAAQRERRAPGDWTVGEDGRKFGMDQQFIYFGKYKLPTVLLALLPINAQANPSMVERNRALQSMKWEIDFHAQRAANEAEFRKAVDELRERRERERQALQGRSVPPPARPGDRVPPEMP